jgi:hypothetical protein
MNKTYEINTWQQRLDQLNQLKQGWNGYDAPAPSHQAVTTAKEFLTQLVNVPGSIEPSRVAPSSVGGVGITCKKRDRRVYIEFFNDGEVCVLFSDNTSEPQSERVEPVPSIFAGLIKRIEDYLDA